MRGLFSMLFGAGCILFVNRLAQRGGINATTVYFRRLLWLLLFGLMNAYVLLWPGDILYEYAICGMFLYAFIYAKARHLLAFSFAVLLICTATGTFDLWKDREKRIKGEQVLALAQKGVTLSKQQEKARQAWQEASQYKKRQIAEAATEIQRKQNGSYTDIFIFHAPVVAHLESETFYHEYFFDDIVAMLLGMALFKWGVLTAQRRRRFYWMLLLAGYGIGLPISWYEHQSLLQTHFDRSLLLDKWFVYLYQLRRIPLMLGHLGFIMLVYKSGWCTSLFRWLSRVGQMAFTNYLMQSIFCAIIFYGFGFGMFGKLQRHEEYYVVAGIWLFQIVFSNIWLRYFRFGPLEWVWRSLTYWHGQPLKRSGPGRAE